MKIKFLITALFTFISISAFTQETNNKTREASIIFYNFQNYGLMYKSGKTDKKLWRFRAVTGGFGKSQVETSNTTEVTVSNFSFNFSVGRERRKPINESLNFVYGIELTSGINYSDNKTIVSNQPISGSQNSNINAGLVGVFGLNYKIKDKFIIGAELLPSAIYSRSVIDPYSSNSFPRSMDSFRFGFGNNSAMLSVGLRF